MNFVATPWDSIIGGLLSKKYEIIISSMAITEERKEKVDFTEPYYRTGAQLFAPADTEMKDAKTDLKGKKIGVVTGTTFTQEVEKLAVNRFFISQTYYPFRIWLMAGLTEPSPIRR